MRRIVCAACKMADGLVILGARHWDRRMHALADTVYQGEYSGIEHEQGFIDQWGEFLNREDALVVATAAGQIIRRCGGDSDELFSENLY
jgi:hypothetical protein